MRRRRAAPARNVLAVSSQHIREHLPTRDTGMHTVDSENHEDSRTSILENKPREEFRPFNNNNDNKYLHKKFKKMASAVLQQDGAGLNHITNLYENIAGDQSSSQPSSYPTPRRSDPPASNQNVSARATTVAPNKFSAVKNNEIENNVQINRKDYNSDKSLAAVGAKSNPNVDRATDPRDAYETSSKDSPNVAGNGRHVCPYCNLSCAKPSVLQKHIRAHTNERPYPCVPCGFAFKTKSNLYKHCRSRSHALRLQGKDETPNNEEDWSLGSEADAVNPTASKPEPPWSVDRVGAPPEPTAVDDNPATDSLFERLSPSNSTNLQVDSKPKSIYKPKFHKASFYQEEEDAYKNMLSPSPEFLNRRISKIILDNEAIVDMRDSHLHRKIGKDNVNHKVIVENHLPDPSKIDNQPLNLTKNSDAVESNRRKRCYSESVLVADSLKVPQHPLNPEGSIIKDLLLKARAQANGLLPASSETYDAAETLYVCPLCQISFKSAENLDTHRSYYCKNSASTLNQNAILNISNSSDLLKFPKPEFMYMRSNSCHVTLSDASTTNVASKYSNAVLKSPLKRANKPENLVILRNEHAEVSAPLPSPGPLLGNTRLVDTQSISESMRSNLLVPDDIERINRISPALKRRTESQSSESMSSLSKFSEESYQRSEIYSPPNKIRCVETPATLRSLEELSLSPMRQNSTSLQMFGGEVKITDNAGGTTTMRIEATSQQSPTMISQSRISPSMLGPETSSVLVRSGLHSGATIVHNPTPKEPLPSPHPQTPRLLVSIAPNLATPNYTVAGIPPPNMSKFQFPIGPITAFNPLTLPALSPVGSPSGAATILHCGKYIPYVPGMPGPNSLNSFASPTQKLSMKSMDNGMSIESIMSNEFAFKERLKSLHMDNESKSTSPIYSHSNMTNSNYMFDRNDSVNKYVDSGINRSKVIPGVKLNFGDSQQTNLKSSKSINFNKKLPQNKIDEILKRNTEILLNSSTNSSDFNMKISKNDLKAVSPDKIPPKNSEDNPEVKFHKEKKSCEMREYNFENLISKSEILNKPIEPVVDDNANQSKSMMDDSTKAQERSETSYFKKNVTTSAGTMISDSQNSKFLRPTSLPLKPGTFTPKRHHGITPNANTLPLISPETPRPAKAYGQLYLNGHAYTYLGLKCSTKVYYCTLNRPQPTYVPEQHSLSMYSNWQVCSESAPHPLGLSPGQAMCLYDSRHRPQNCVVSKMKQDHLMTHSSQWAVTAANQTPSVISDGDKADESRIPANELNSVANKTSKSLAGGFESNEEYIYVPGRGRGRYVCSECGIRCKKPSMLKKHIRTHTDVRPFTCKHCSFSFKTKGNLTKHMKSKAHYRKCCELGISPLEGVDGSDMSHSLGDSDDDSDTHDDGNEGETESSDTDSCKSRQEHEAAHCLLSLWGGRPAPGLLSTARPTTYPYTPNTSNHSDVLSITEDSKLPETSFSPIKETASVIRKHPITPLSLKQDKSMRRSTSIMSPIDLSKPMDLSRNDAKDGSRTDKPLTMCPAEDILTPVGEPDLLASLAMSTSKYSRINNWNDDDEPMLQAYLTEKALQDSRIKQCQYTNGRIRRDDIDMEPYRNNTKNNDANLSSNVRETTVITSTQIIVQMSNKPEASLNHMHDNDSSGIQTLAEIAASSVRLKTPPVSTNPEKKSIAAEKPPKGTENAKFVASEYLKVVRGKSNADVESYNTDVNNKGDNVNASNIDDNSSSEKDGDVQKINAEHFGVARKVVVGEGSVGFKLTKLSSEYSTFASLSKGSLTEDGRSICVVCNKTFSKPSQLLLHINIHYIERPFRCSACAVSFRTRGHLQKHERSGSHHNKVSMTSTFGTATTTNPRPFKCSDCKIAFRIHGHLAKHLRSKMHVMRLECLGKLPFGTFAEIERAGVSLTDIDTTDCDNSLASLQILAQKLHEKDPTKLDKWDPMTMTPPLLPPGHESSDEEEPSSPMAHSIHMGDHDARAVNDSDSPDEINVKYSATNT